MFRSSPVIQLALTMKVNNGGLIDPDGGSVMLSVCSSFESKFSVPEICTAIDESTCCAVSNLNFLSQVWATLFILMLNMSTNLD